MAIFDDDFYVIDVSPAFSATSHLWPSDHFTSILLAIDHVTCAHTSHSCKGRTAIE